MDTEHKFKYESIATDKIRVFSIFPSEDSDGLNISMQDRGLERRRSLSQAAKRYSTKLLRIGSANLLGYQHEANEEDLPFIAISYSWGDQNNKVSILCDGMNLEITQSLDGALRRLRQKGEKGRIWADACTDSSQGLEHFNRLSLKIACLHLSACLVTPRLI